ncbi:MAG: ISAs1 family transposase [Caedimonas sp.]|nr:ISAs1 family transposase [Caedimonas sp.]
MQIKAIPHLLEVLDLERAIVTIDAMGCQCDIAQAIVEKKADYVLSLKGNQGTLHKDVELIFKDRELMKELMVDQAHTIDGSEHGRLEKRNYRAIICPEFFKKQHDWPYLQSLVEVISYREIKGIASQEVRYHITSLDPIAEKIGQAIRSHWAIENSLTGFWILALEMMTLESGVEMLLKTLPLLNIWH